MRSLTLIEPPLYHLLPEDPEVENLQRTGDAVLTHGLQADPSMLREFLALAGAPDEPDDQPPLDDPHAPDGPLTPDGPLPEKLAYSVRHAHGGCRDGGRRALRAKRTGLSSAPHTPSEARRSHLTHAEAI